MPRFDQITIQTVDLDTLVQAVAVHKPAGGVITIIDNGPSLTIRDKDNLLISSIKKTVPDDQP